MRRKSGEFGHICENWYEVLVVVGARDDDVPVGFQEVRVPSVKGGTYTAGRQAY